VCVCVCVSLCVHVCGVCVCVCVCLCVLVCACVGRVRACMRACVRKRVGECVSFMQFWPHLSPRVWYWAMFDPTTMSHVVLETILGVLSITTSLIIFIRQHENAKPVQYPGHFQIWPIVLIIRTWVLFLLYLTETNNKTYIIPDKD